jgi:SAM-dependent methyltransferase
MTNQQTNTPSDNICPVCGSGQLIPFFQMLDVPVHSNLLWQSREAALNCPKGDIKLTFCPVCSFITNLAFEPTRPEYSQAYDASLHFSPYFQEYARSLASRLVERHDLYNKDIIEIGCGKGFFISLLCKLGNNRGVGIDPAYTEQEKDSDEKDQVKFIQDFYSEKYGNYQSDIIVCRHVLEHIQNPKDFLKMIRHAIGNRLNTHVFFEVPNALQTFQRLFIWDIIYEHCSYFTPNALSLIFSYCGFRVCDLTEEYQGQFLCIDARPENQGILDSIYKHREVNQISNYIRSFPDNYRSKFETCRHELEKIEAKGQSVVAWGAGSKGVTFLNTFKNSEIEYVVDINPYKQGMYIPGTGQKIVPPEFLKNYKPDSIIIMNPIYKNEIRELINRLGLNTKFLHI